MSIENINNGKLFFFFFVKNSNLNCLVTIQIQEISFYLIKYHYLKFLLTLSKVNQNYYNSFLTSI